MQKLQIVLNSGFTESVVVEAHELRQVSELVDEPNLGGFIGLTDLVSTSGVFIRAKDISFVKMTDITQTQLEVLQRDYRRYND